MKGRDHKQLRPPTSKCPTPHRSASSRGQWISLVGRIVASLAYAAALLCDALLESGVNLRLIQKFLGHASLQTNYHVLAHDNFGEEAAERRSEAGWVKAP